MTDKELPTMQAQAVAPGEHDTKQDEAAIRGLKDLFAKGIMTKDPKLRASIWTQDGTLAPPTGGFFEGAAAIEKDFEQESASITGNTTAQFSNYRFRFLTRDIALVDADLAIRNVLGPEHRLLPVLQVSLVFTAVRRDGKWFVQDERAHFVG
jgi:uncharacterized protein (TIGR02246 family)